MTHASREKKEKAGRRSGGQARSPRFAGQGEATARIHRRSRCLDSIACKILSPVLWDELVATLRRKFGVTPDDLPILALYRQHAAWCEPARLAKAVSPDPDDDWVLATAVAGDAEAIVSGDADLLTLDSYSGIQLLSPRQFVSRQASSGRG